MLTVVAGLSRLLTAGLPALWADEAHTYRRVCGTFAQLTAMLRSDAFPPLHYWVYWLLGRALGGPQHLTPFWMRFIPALAGTLMVPVMWRLAGQFCGRRTALLVAAFTACSAFLFAHSHDAKMYMPLWLLVAVNFSWWVSWLREERSKHWIVWVTSGVLMVGYHASGAVMLSVEIASLLAVGRVRSRKALSAALGIAVIAGTLAAYYTWGNQLFSRSRDAGWHNASGLSWLREYDPADAHAINPVLKLTTAYLSGWLWPGSSSSLPFDSRVRAALTVSVIALLLLVIAGGVVWLFRLMRARNGETGRQLFFRTFVLGFWLVVPIYVAYRLSVGKGTESERLVTAAAVLCFAAACATVLKLAWGPVRRWLASRRVSVAMTDALGSLVVLAWVAITAGSLAAALARSSGESSSVWMPRYLGFVWPAFAIAVCAAISALRPAALRWGAVVLLIGVNVAQSAALVIADSEPPIGRIVSDVYAADQTPGLRTYVFADVPGGAGCAGGTVQDVVGRYYLSLASQDRLGPDGFFKAPLGAFADVRLWSEPRDIVDDLTRGKPPQRLIIWDYIRLSGTEALPVNALGPQWHAVHEQSIAVRCHWVWSTNYWYRRTEYARQSSQEQP